MAYILWLSACLFFVKPVYNIVPTVNTTCGPVAGRARHGAYSFIGIPYAEPPAGHLRWKPPRKMSPAANNCWKGVLTARPFGASCFQRDFLNHSHMFGDEDCLYINVWTPAITKTPTLPVMVWIHGGFLEYMNGTVRTYSPTEGLAAETNIVYVSFNYRLHAFGFLALQMLADHSDSKTSGNYGFMDQILALEWVRDNIQFFSGDPNQVTIFGQSSGGTSIFALLASPLAQGLFHKAWMISASPVMNKTAAEAYQDNEVFLHNTGCTDIICLYNLSPQEVTLAVPWDVYPSWSMSDQNDLPIKGVFDGALAVVDGVVLKEAPLEAWKNGRAVDVPVIVGTVANEIDDEPTPSGVKTWTWSEYEQHVRNKLDTFGQNISKEALRRYPSGHISPEYQFTRMATDLRMTCPNDVMTKIAAHNFKSPVYRYVGTAIPSQPINALQIPFPAAYSFHLWDVFAFFGSISDYITPTQGDMDWQKNVRREILSFVHTGRPFTKKWTDFRNGLAILSQNTTVVGTFADAHCDFWLQNGFFSYGWIN